MQRLFRRIQGIFQVGTVSVAGDDAGEVQTAQVTVSGRSVRNGLPVVQQYGFSAVLPAGTDAVILSISGDASNGAIIGTLNKAARPKNLAQGQVCIFTEGGDQILLDNSGGTGIVMKPAAGKVKIEGDLDVTGDANITGDAVIGGISFEKHVHRIPSGADLTEEPQ
ncbi:phage baseplate assembly protein domain-containing protein [Gluconobacter morbifer]|uniref:phage baseplate assembly protein domain-containing protein n=1 Tax=Gluconobacter morbifer TaxID=479935 RepID=UPI001584CD89|nr:phage baseplate assembly protein [Gluconobacter morbifer]